MTPNLLGRIFGTNKIFGAISLNLTLNFNLFCAGYEIESTLNFLRIYYFANKQNHAKLAIYAKKLQKQNNFLLLEHSKTQKIFNSLCLFELQRVYCTCIPSTILQNFLNLFYRGPHTSLCYCKKKKTSIERKRLQIPSCS